MCAVAAAAQSGVFCVSSARDINPPAAPVEVKGLTPSGTDEHITSQRNLIFGLTKCLLNTEEDALTSCAPFFIFPPRVFKCASTFLLSYDVFLIQQKFMQSILNWILGRNVLNNLALPHVPC